MKYETCNMKYAGHKTEKSGLPYSIFHIPYSRGFTIVETLVAVSILLLSITAPLTIAEKGLASAEVASKGVTAFYLAQEAIEYVRNVRDTNALGGLGGKPNWLKDLNDCLKSFGCGIDTTETTKQTQIVACRSDNANDCKLAQYIGDSTNPVNPNSELFGIFGHRTASGWKDANITRIVHIREVQKNIEAEVEVTVVWNAGAFGPRTLKVKENIFNWYTSK